MIIPTPRFMWLLALGIIVALVGLVVPGFQQLTIAYNLTLFGLMFVSAYTVPPADRFSVKRSMDSLLSARATNPVHLTMSVASNRTQTVQVRDEPPAEFTAENQNRTFRVHPGRETAWSYEVVPTQRGAFGFRGTFIRVLGPLGLAWRQYQLANEQPVRVYPNVKAVREFDLLNRKGKLKQIGIRKSRLKGLGTEFESLREYDQDDFRRIDWSATARRGKLIVREYETERNQSVIVCFDCSRTMLAEINGVSKLDYALDAALMLLNTANSQGDLIGLMVFGDQIKRYIAPRKGRAQLGMVLDAMHSLEAEPFAANYARAMSYLNARWKRRSLVVVFTDAADGDEGKELATGLRILTKRHLVITVRVSDPRVRKLMVETAAIPERIYDQAAAIWYHDEAEKARLHISAARSQCMDSEPDELAARLVSAYFRVKESAAL